MNWNMRTERKPRAHGEIRGQAARRHNRKEERVMNVRFIRLPRPKKPNCPGFPKTPNSAHRARVARETLSPGDSRENAPPPNKKWTKVHMNAKRSLSCQDTSCHVRPMETALDDQSSPISMKGSRTTAQAVFALPRKVTPVLRRMTNVNERTKNMSRGCDTVLSHRITWQRASVNIAQHDQLHG